MYHHVVDIMTVMTAMIIMILITILRPTLVLLTAEEGPAALQAAVAAAVEAHNFEHPKESTRKGGLLLGVYSTGDCIDFYYVQ